MSTGPTSPRAGKMMTPLPERELRPVLAGSETVTLAAGRMRVPWGWIRERQKPLPDGKTVDTSSPAIRALGIAQRLPLPGNKFGLRRAYLVMR
jgi:hypothetical protein